MELKRPFSDEDFQATPEPVKRYIIQLENVVLKLLKETEDLKKRVTKLESRRNKNSQNSSMVSYGERGAMAHKVIKEIGGSNGSCHSNKHAQSGL